MYGAAKRKCAMKHRCLRIKSEWERHFRACSVELTVFFPAFGPSAFFQFIEYSRALTALILPSIPLVILTSLLTAHTAETPSKHVRTYGKHGFLEGNWQSLPANKGTREQSGAFMKVTPATPRRSQSLINGPLKHSGSLYVQCEKHKCSIASNDTVCL